jgi:hypothetical protein
MLVDHWIGILRSRARTGSRCDLGRWGWIERLGVDPGFIKSLPSIVDPTVHQAYRFDALQI